MLNFEYVESSGFPAVSRAEYRGLIIEAVQDQDCSNPWTDCDGLAPLLWTNGDGGEEYGDADLESPLKRFSDWQISRHWRALCAILAPDCDADSLSAELAKARRDNPPQWRASLAELKREALEERLGDLKPDGWRSWPVDYYDVLQQLWSLAGIEALDFQRNGYSQGDSVLGLLVATPEWRKAMGIPAGHDMQADLKRQADLFGHWAFGDCYGFVIKSPDGESLDSVWGYIGDPDESGLAEAATESADSILASAAKRKAEKLKELIRNRVPLDKRPALLAEAGELREPVYMTAAQWRAAKESA